MENIFANGSYFKKNPDNILAEQKEGKSKYGKVITLYKGNINNVDRINATANLTAVNYDNPLSSELTTDIINLTDKNVEQIDNINYALSQTNKDVEEKLKRDYKKIKSKGEVATSSTDGIETRSLEDVWKEINPEVSIEELRVFLWYCNQISKPVTNMEWFNIAGTTPTMLMRKKDAEIKEWYEEGLVFYNGLTKEIEPAWLYLSGDVYRKHTLLNKQSENSGQDADYIIEKYGQKAFERQKQELEKVFKMQYDKRLVINSSDKNSLKLLPNSKFAKKFIINTLIDEQPFKWKKVTAASNKNYGKPDFLFTGYVKEYDKKEFTELSLRDAFCLWLVSDKSIQFKKGMSYAEIINYYIFAKQKPKTSAEKDADGKYRGDELKKKQQEDAQFERLKSKAKQEGDRLFSIFIDKYLLLNDKIRLETEWNMTFNNNVPINYNKIPVAFRMNKFINGQPLDVRDEKREAVAFTLSNGSGLLAFDVGVGKTPSAIFTISAFLDLGWAKRPLVVVPNQTYKQWISEFKSFAGHIKLNKLYNLNDSVIEDFQDTNGNTLKVDEGSVTIMTYEGMLNLGFSDKVGQSMKDEIGAILMQSVEGKSDKELERQQLKLNTQIEELLGKALRGTKINIDDLGLDYLCLDEAHACKKVFTNVAGEREGDNEKGKKVVEYKINSGEPSSTAIKGFVLTQYIQNTFKGNTQLLTATPFTNSPLEVFSMLAMVGYNRLQEQNLNNLKTFFDTFVDVSYEMVINAALNPERKQVILGFNNLLVLQQLVRQFINHKTGESVGVKRPNKYVLPYAKVKVDGVMIDLPEDEKVNTAIPLTLLQKEYMAKVKDYAEGTISHEQLCTKSSAKEDDEEDLKDDDATEIDESAMDEDEKKGVRLLRALNFSRNIAFSPYLFDCGEGLLRPTAKQFIETSGKLTYVVESIRSIKAHHEKTNTPMSGCVIYSERGVEFFPLIREYLIEYLGFKPHEVGIISSKLKMPLEKGVSDEEAKEYIKNSFLGKRFNKKTLELEPLSDEERMKVLIGSATIREGINLQAYSSTLFNCFLSFNPTDIQQLEGRIYRQGNTFKNVRIVNPLMIDSADIFMFQKLEEKTSRINSIFDTDGATNVLKTEEFNPKELKYALIKDPRVLAKMEVMEEQEALEEDIKDKQSDLIRIDNFKEDLGNVNYYQKQLLPVIQDVRPKLIDKPISVQIKGIQDFWRKPIDEDGLYVKSYWNDDVPKEYKDKVSDKKYPNKPYWFDKLVISVRNADRFRKDFLAPRGVADQEIDLFKKDLEVEIEGLKEYKSKLNSEEAQQMRLMEVMEKKAKMQIKEESVETLVSNFARMNYLLDDVALPKVKEVKAMMCPPIDENGKVRIDAEGLTLLDDCIKAQPQTKYLNSIEIKKDDGTVEYEYTDKRKELHKEIIKDITRNAICTEQIQPIAIIMGGAPGSGKSTFIRNNAPYLQSDKIWKVDADEVRSMLPEFRGWNAPATHEEAKDIVNLLLDKYDTPCKHDLLYDGTMSNVKKYRPLIKRLKNLGYKVFLVFMDVPKEISIQRALDRFRNGEVKGDMYGRYVPLNVIEDFYGTGDEAFQLLKKEVDGYIKVNGLSQKVVERGGMQVPEDRNYSQLGEEKPIVVETIKTGTGDLPLGYKVVVIPGQEDFKYYVIRENDKQYVVVNEEKVENWKNSSDAAEKAHYYEEVFDKSEVVEFKPEPKKEVNATDKIAFIEKRVKALEISLRFAKDKAFIEKRIKGLSISLRALKAKSEAKEETKTDNTNQSPKGKIVEIVDGQFKGEKGLITSYELVDGNYQVQMEDGSMKGINPSHLRLLKYPKQYIPSSNFEEWLKLNNITYYKRTYYWVADDGGDDYMFSGEYNKVLKFLKDLWKENSGSKPTNKHSQIPEDSPVAIYESDLKFKKGDILVIDMGSSEENVTVGSDFKAGVSKTDFITLNTAKGAPYTITLSRLQKVLKKIINKDSNRNKKKSNDIIFTATDPKYNITYTVEKSKSKDGIWKLIESRTNWIRDYIYEYASEKYAVYNAKVKAGLIKGETDPEKAFMVQNEKSVKSDKKNTIKAKKDIISFDYQNRTFKGNLEPLEDIFMEVFDISKRFPSILKFNKSAMNIEFDYYISKDEIKSDKYMSELLKKAEKVKSKIENEYNLSVKYSVVNAEEWNDFKNSLYITIDEKIKFAGGGNVGDAGSVHIVDEGQGFDENRYGAIFEDYDGDGVVNIDDAYPNDPNKQGFVEKVRLQPIFKKLIDLKSNLNKVMYDTVGELKDKSPKTADIYARTKTPYSIMKKLVEKRLMDEAKGLTDLVGTTIAVDNYNDLMEVKSQIDSGLLGKVIDFDDFYAKPKAGYMAYHYIIKTDDGYSVEVQLKTKRMKNLNKVSHEFYKLGNLDSKNFLEVTELTHSADLGNKKSISQYNMLMQNNDLLRDIMTGKTNLKNALEQNPELLAKGGYLSDEEIFANQFGKK